MTHKIILPILASSLSLLLTSCDPVAGGYSPNPYPPYGGGYSGGYGGSYYPPSRDYNYDRRNEHKWRELKEEKKELEEDRRELERERERQERERREMEEARRREEARREERCPSGFHPGNHRCSKEDRKNGCKDMRMPGGTTCNAGPFS